MNYDVSASDTERLNTSKTNHISVSDVASDGQCNGGYIQAL